MKKPVVICVDDEPTILDSLKIELRRSIGQQCLVETAEDGADALELMEDLQHEDNPVALVIADYIMPGLKGDELLREVHLRSPQTLNIMLSGQADLDAVSRTIESAQLYRFITKPWNPDDLGLTVTQAIQSYFQNRQIEQQTSELQTLYHELKRLNESLEHQVQQRTAQLRQSIQELQLLSALKDDLLHAVSHDLRTPIAGMLMVLRRLQAKAGDPVLLDRPTLERLVQGGEHQLQLLETLLEAHQSDVHGLSLKQEVISIGEWITAMVQDLEPWVQGQGGTLRSQLPADLPQVWGDRLQLRRVFENVIANALKHNPPGVVIEVTATVLPDQLRWSVRDNGLGMPQSECDRLFERYQRGVSRSPRSVGLGLGLFLCRQIIREHGGQIGAISAPGEGFEVWFTLPLESVVEPSHEPITRPENEETR